MCAMFPRVMTGIAETALAHHAITGVFPRWTFAGREINCMPGMHGLTLTYQAIAHGLVDREFERRALAAFLDTASGCSAFASNQRVNKELRGLVANNGVLLAGARHTQTVSQTLEYAIVFESIARLAARLGDAANAERFGALARAYTRLYDPRARLLVALRADGTRARVSDPTRASSMGESTEGNALQWLFHAPHDLSGLIALVGEEDGFDAQLAALFDATHSAADNLPDHTGLIGAYAHGNEPSHHIPFLLFLRGDAARGRAIVARLRAMYTDAPDGLCGNDDAGQLSAWYIAATIGVYSLDPLAPTLLSFDSSTSRLLSTDATEAQEILDHFS